MLEQVNTLIEKAAKTHNADAALKFSQAAANVALALRTSNEVASNTPPEK